MGRRFDAIPDHLAGWMEQQPIFFVASAPLAGDGHVNVSPKGGDTFRVLGDRAVAYLDLTGSGIETVAHVRENERLTVMFCSFDEQPNIVRLFGRASAVLAGDDGFDDLAARFPAIPGARSVIRLDVDLVTTACGFAVPLMSLVAPRDTLTRWAEGKGDDGLAAYWAEKNAASIDGLPGVPAPGERVTTAH